MYFKNMFLIQVFGNSAFNKDLGDSLKRFFFRAGVYPLNILGFFENRNYPWFQRAS